MGKRYLSVLRAAKPACGFDPHKGVFVGQTDLVPHGPQERIRLPLGHMSGKGYHNPFITALAFGCNPLPKAVEYFILALRSSLH